MQLTAGKLWGMRRIADPSGRFKMTAADQRPPIKNPIAAHHGVAEAPWEAVARFKSLLIETLQGESTAMLLEPHYAIPHGINHYSPQKGLIVTLEDSLFEETEEGRFSAEIDNWSVGKIKRMGGDGVKVLVWYRPDAGAKVLKAQQDFSKRVGDACAKYDIPYVFELLVYPLAGDADQTQDYREMKGKRADDVLASVEEFAKPDYGVDLFKLESPVEASQAPGVDASDAAQTQSIFDELGKVAGRPWVMLSAGAGKEDFRRVLSHAYAAGASGYLAGRAIWLDAFGAYPDWDAMRTKLETDSVNYMQSLNELTDQHASRWYQHSCYGESGALFNPASAEFRNTYEDM